MLILRSEEHIKYFNSLINNKQTKFVISYFDKDKLNIYNSKIQEINLLYSEIDLYIDKVCEAEIECDERDDLITKNLDIIDIIIKTVFNNQFMS